MKHEVERVLHEWDIESYPSDDEVNPRNSPTTTAPYHKSKVQGHRAEIRADKRHWKKTHTKEDNSALSSIASFRLRQYLERPIVPSPESNEVEPKSIPMLKSKKIPQKEAKILSSGSSSLDIADAFLQSTLGKDLIQYPRSEYQENDEAENSSAKLSELQQNPKKPNDDEFYKSYYSQNWQTKKGGWVGDFGPSHTHPLSSRNSNEDGVQKKY